MGNSSSGVLLQGEEDLHAGVLLIVDDVDVQFQFVGPSRCSLSMCRYRTQLGPLARRCPAPTAAG